MTRKNAKRENIAQDFAAAAHVARYRFDYAAEVADFYQAAPEFQGRIFFYDGQTSEMVSGADKPPTECVNSLAVRLRRSLQIAAEGGYSLAMPLPELKGAGVIVNPKAARENLPALLGHGTSTDVEALYILDHEIGHVTCPDGIGTNSRYGDSKLYEGVADAYATLRHIQRFGTATPALKNVVDIRSVELVFRHRNGTALRADSGTHYTAPVIERIIAESARIDFTQLSLAQTREVARRYAMESHMHPHYVSYTSEAFAAFKNKLPDIAEGDNDVLTELGAFLLATKEPAVFETGAVALRALLDGKVVCNGQRILPKGRAWMDLRQDIEARAAVLKEEGSIMFGIAKPAAKPHTPPQP